MSKQWKSVPKYEGMYEASIYGEIRSLDRYVQCKGGGKRLVRGFITRTFTNKFGYKRVVLFKNSKQHKFQLHRVIAMTFLDNPCNKPEVNHRNGNKLDNNIKNLEWVTRKENTDHAVETGLIKYGGENHMSAKLRTKDVNWIRTLAMRGWTRKELGNIFPVTSNHIGRIINHDLW